MLGYLSSPPVPGDEIAQQLKNRKPLLDSSVGRKEN